MLQPLFKQSKNTTAIHRLTSRLLTYIHKYIFNTAIDLLQLLFGNLFIYLDRVEIVILIYAGKYTFITLVDLIQYLFGNLFIYLDRVEIVFSKEIIL